LIRVVVALQPLGTIPVATEVTREELLRTVSLAAKPSARLRWRLKATWERPFSVRILAYGMVSSPKKL
jgi:hypothetical protein